MNERPSVLRETDENALLEARTLMRGARFGTLAVLDPETGFPNASRVLLATTPYGTPAILVSSLSTHTRALDADPRCSLLTGEPGKGDPLAHPRLSLQARAVAVDRESEMHGWLRSRFLRRHPKAALYIDFGDFRFLTLEPVLANLNGGFGKAYRIDGQDLVIRHPDIVRLARQETEILEEISRSEADLATSVAKTAFQKDTLDWKISAIDTAGIDISGKDVLKRLEIDFEDVSMARIVSDIRKVGCTIP